MSVNQILLNIAALLGTFVIGAAAIALIYAGYLLIFSLDNPEQVRRAKGAIYGVIFGVILVVFSVGLATALNNAIHGQVPQQQQQAPNNNQPVPLQQGGQ